MKEIRGKKLKK